MQISLNIHYTQNQTKKTTQEKNNLKFFLLPGTFVVVVRIVGLSCSLQYNYF